MPKTESAPEAAPRGRSRSLRLLLAGALSLVPLTACGGGGGGSQAPGAGTPATVTALSPDARVDLPGRVSVFLKVTEGDGSPAADLTGADFNVYENEQLVSQTESAQRLVAQPQVFRSYLHLILDRSNSVQSAGAAEVQEGARQFIEAVTAEPENFVKISWFDGSPMIHEISGFDFGFSNDRELLLAAIDALDNEPPFSTSTNLYGAVVDGISALDEVDVSAANTGVENRSLTLVTFTDGTHQAGPAVTLQDALDAIDGVSPEGTEHTAFTIGVGQEYDASVLAALGPNGTATATEFGELADAFEQIGAQVRDLANSFYFLSYCSPKTSGINGLRISVLPQPNNSADAQFTFDAQFFGGGCAFLDIKNHPELGGAGARAFISDAVELASGEVLACGWRTDDCLEPGCGTASTAFVARFRASDASEVGANLPDGRLDPDFGDGGVRVLEVSPFDVSGATSLAVDALTGDLIVGGWARGSVSSGFSQASLWRVAPDGATSSREDLPNPSITDQAVLDLAPTASGGFVAVGFVGIGSRSFVTWSLLSDLTLDSGFGTAGVVISPATPEFGNEGASEVVVAGDRYYVVGHAGGGIRVLAIDPTSGGAVPGFGGGTVEPLRFFGGATYGARCGEATLDSASKLVLAGSLSGAFGGAVVRDQPAVWRVLADGSPDTSFAGSLSSPTTGTGVVTLREGSTNNSEIDFGRNTSLNSLAIGPDGTLIAAGQRENAEGHTDLAVFAFGSNGVLSSAYNFLGFLIDDGASADDSFESGSVVRVLQSGAIWTLGSSNPNDPAGVAGTDDVPTIWVDREPARVFPPIGN